MHRLLPIFSLTLLLFCFHAHANNSGHFNADLPWTWHPRACATCTKSAAPVVKNAGPHVDAFIQQSVFSDPFLGASEHLWLPFAIDDDTFVVGSLGEIGAVHVFVRSGDQWAEQAQLLPNNGQFDLAATEAAIDGDTLVLGQPGRTGTTGYPFAGAVSVFVRSGSVWTLQADLQLDDALDGDYFGVSVAIAGDTLVAGRSRTQNQVVSGDAHVYVRQGSTWTHQATLTASEPQFATAFGYSVAMSGDTIVVGEPGHSTSGNASWEGALYVFVRVGDSWVQQARFEGNAPDDVMGYSVDVDGDIAVTDIIGEDTNGGVYVYRRDGSEWLSPPTFIANPDTFAPMFGASLAVDDSIVVVGDVNGSSMNLQQSGTVYVYTLNGDEWLQQAQLHDDTPAPQHHFGEQVAIDKGTILVAEPGNPATQIGSLHVFTDVPVPTTTMITSVEPWQVLQGESYVVHARVVADHPYHGTPLGTVEISDPYGNRCTLTLATEDSCSMTAGYANPSDPFGTFVPLTASFTPSGSIAYLPSAGEGFQLVQFVDAIFSDGFD